MVEVRRAARRVRTNGRRAPPPGTAPRRGGGGLVLGAALAVILLPAALVFLPLRASAASRSFVRARRVRCGADSSAWRLRSSSSRAGVGQRIEAGIALLLGERAQHDAGGDATAAPQVGRRGPCRRGRGGGRRFRDRSSLWGAGFVLPPGAGRPLTVSTTTAFERPCEKLSATLLDRALQGQRLGRHMQRLVARCLVSVIPPRFLRVHCRGCRAPGERLGRCRLQDRLGADASA